MCLRESRLGLKNCIWEGHSLLWQWISGPGSWFHSWKRFDWICSRRRCLLCFAWLTGSLQGGNQIHESHLFNAMPKESCSRWWNYSQNGIAAVIRWADVIHCLQQMFYGRPVIPISQHLVQAWMHLTYMRVLMPTFSPPCDCEEAAPGCVGAGDDTELWMTLTAGCTLAAGSSLGDLPLSASAAPAEPASVEELLV